MKKIIILVLTLLLLILPLAFAKQGHMKLLAVSDTEKGQEGGIADLYLEIKPGSGRVFLETFPLTRLDTQISTRFAKEIACDYSNVNCENYDFFYTITANSPIIAGPSAGAAIATLTYSLIEDLDLKSDVAITGTINSGGLIGPVGGLKAKIEAGAKADLRIILIPKGEKIIKEDNKTINLSDYSKKLNIEIKEVSNLNEVMEEFTGKKIKEPKGNLTINPAYRETMKTLAIDLCSKTTRMQKNISNYYLTQNISIELRKAAENLTEKGKEAFSNGFYYSSASYCFGANVQYNALLFVLQNLTEEDIVKKVNSISSEIKALNEKIENADKKTITDLEAYMVVKERLMETSEFLGRILTNEGINNTQRSINDLAYATERLYSARSWETFLDNRGKKFNLNQDILKKTCQRKLSEVEERFQYVNIYFPTTLENTRKELDYAYKDLENENFELCIFRASKAKAGVDVILSVFGVDQSQVDDILNQKLDIAKESIIKETEKDIFPILGYSYYEYATDLKESDIYSALLYSEYALELSNLDIYFKDDNKKIGFKLNFDKKTLFIFIFGLLIGAISIKIIDFQRRKYRKFKIKKTKKK